MPYNTPEKLQAYNARAYLNMTDVQREARRQANRRWYAKNREKLCVRTEAQRAAHLEVARKSREKHREKNREKRNAYQRAWVAANPNKVRMYPSRDRAHRYEYRLATKYGMQPADYQAIWDAQEGRCALCQHEFSAGARRAVVDHNHETNRIRGLLCGECNVGLGKLGDTVESLLRAVKYLKDGYV